MIAIACAKGGSGKTTTTLGLAGAYARAGEESLAIDADRQLPDLHMTAGVERNPTIADVADAGDWRSVAKPLPGTNGAYVLPGAKADDVLDLQSTLEGLRRDSTRVLVDCPSGSGPDVIDPIAASDGVVIATSPSKRGVGAARTTVDVARQLDVPVVGVVVTKCDEPVDAVDVDIQAPVLATVPKCDDPLADERAASAYDAVVEAILENEVEPTAEADSEPEPAESTGTAAGPDAQPDAVHPGDERAVAPPVEDLLTGFDPGTVVSLHAPPASQSEAILYQATAVRGTLYLTTIRSADLVKHAIDQSRVETGSPTVRALEDDDQLAEATSLIEQLPDHSNLVVDTTNALERADRDAYVEFLNTLSKRAKATDSLAILHCLEPASNPESRRLTDHVADVVLTADPDDSMYTAQDTLSLSKRRTTNVHGPE